MSSPVGSRSPSPLPHSSSQEPYQREPLTGSTSNYLLQTILLLEDLMAFSLKRKESTILTQSPILRSFNVLTVKAASEQIKSLAIGLSKTCAEIAQALLACNISLEDSLLANRALNDQELALIKTSLTSLEERSSQEKELAASSRKDTEGKGQPSSEDTTLLQQQRHLPLKKQKLRWGALAAPETPPLPETTPKVTCSLEALEALLTTIQMNSMTNIPVMQFSCPGGHSEESCAMCLPLQTLLENLKAPFMEASIWQLAILLQHTTARKLAESLCGSESILQKVLEGSVLLNHQLAILIDSCDISDAICLPKQENPRLLAKFYRTLESVLSSGMPSPFVQAVLNVWKKESQTLDPTASITVVTNDKSLTLQKHDFRSLAKEVPAVTRSYFYTTRDQNFTSYRKLKMTRTFSEFVAKIAIRTVQALQSSQAYSFLFKNTPEGPLPDNALIERIFVLILLSSSKWQIFVSPCRASSGHHPHRSALSEAETELLYAALKNFAKKNSISLQGSSNF
ncbi:hypothetical protein [Chlamydiifrater phoenicopteri]|uniref:hypothetical protein n=1 Tax=Chlamydiifrater phoenicopteri TaxID=2681469 RepID=UPI001BCB55B5|nr:hypothetical protein [Chlamydiifrater phoenicopteri]